LRSLAEKTDRTFAQSFQINGEDSALPGEEYLVSIDGNATRKGMQPIAIGQLRDFASGKADLKQVGFARSVRSEYDGLLVRREGRVEKIKMDVDTRVIGELMNHRAGIFIAALFIFGPKYPAFAKCVHDEVPIRAILAGPISMRRQL
jgi:hypothetical protein